MVKIMRQSPRRPFARSVRTLAAMIAAALVAVILTPAAATAASGPAGEVFSLTNAERTQAGLPALVSDPVLDAAATEWARQLASTCTFEHSTASWRSSQVAAYGWTATGENIGAGQPDASSVVIGWMNSADHRANFLETRYRGLGVGYATGSFYQTYWVQIFGIGSPIRHLPGGAGDLTADGATDVLALTSAGDLLIYPGNASGGWKTAVTASASWGDRPFTTLGDFTGDSIPDIARVEADGRLMLHSGNGRGGLLAPVQIGIGWTMFSQLIGGIDFNGDRLPDVIGRTPGGDLFLYVGNGSGSWLGGGYKIGNGWTMMDFVVHAGDFNGDSRGDIIARQPNGTLWLYPTTGNWGWAAPYQIGWGWHALTAIFGAGDFDGNGTQDILARASDGSLIMYGGNGRGGWGTIRTVGSGWNGMRQIG